MRSAPPRLAASALALVVLAAGACTRDAQAAKAKYLASGDEYAASGKLSEAIIEYKNAVQQDPHAGDARLKLADAYTKAGALGDAVDEYVLAADLLPEDSAVHLKTGSALLLAGRADEARSWAEKVLSREPKNLQAQLLLANALAGLRDLDGAVAEIEEAIQLDPSRGQTYTNLGAFELGRGQKEAADRAFTKAVELAPQSSEVRLALANFYWVSARWSEAEQELKKVIEIEPGNALAQRVLAAFYIATRRPAEAEPHLKKVQEITRTPAAAFALADYYAYTGDAAKAEAMLRRAIENDPSYLDAYAALARLYVSQRRLDAALAEYEELAKRDARAVGALTFAGIILHGQGKVNEARDHFVRALQLDPDAPVAANNLAWLYAQTDENLDRALELALRARAKLPDRPEVNDTVGWVHYRKDRAAEAIPYFEKSIEKDANNPLYHYHLGLALAKSGDAARGRQALDKALEIKPDFDGSADARGTLATLSP